MHRRGWLLLLEGRRPPGQGSSWVWAARSEQLEATWFRSVLFFRCLCVSVRSARR